MKKITILIAMLMAGCQFDQIDLQEMKDHNKIASGINEKVVYNGETYYLSYSINSDSTINFQDSKSEENYNFISYNLSDKPTASIFISISDSTTYLFDDNVQFKKFVDNRSGKNKNKGEKAKRVRITRKREDITSKFANRKIELDSGMSKNKFVYNYDEFEEYSMIELIGSFKKVKMDTEKSNPSGRMVWRTNACEIRLYEHINYGGSSYEVLSSSNIESFEAYQTYYFNMTAFNDKTSSYIVYNGSTRTMIVNVWEHADRGARSWNANSYAIWKYNSVGTLFGSYKSQTESELLDVLQELE